MVISFRLALTGLLILCAPLSVRADDEPSDKSTAEPKTHTVERQRFKVEVEVDGVFEAVTRHEVSLQPEVWTSLKVEKAVEEGASVTQGEPVLWLETKELDNEIRDLEFSRELGYLSLKQAEVELQSLEKSVPLDLESARRSRQVADEDLDYFLKVDEDHKKRSAEESLESAEHSLEYAQEELDQLEQMYKADDLTEETEEIILKRAKRSVERGKFYLESAQLRHDRTLQFLLPREKLQVQESAARSDLNLAKAEATLPTQLDKKRIELEKLQHAHQQTEEKLALLRADRELMVLEAPAAGVVYYGESERGKWSTAASVRSKLRPGGSVSANSVLMTVVPPGPLVVRIDVPEDKFRFFVKKGTPARILPKAYPDAEYPGTSEKVSPIAVKEGVYDGRISIDAADDGPQPLGGMTCKVVLIAYSNDDALTVPAEAVFDDGEDPEQKYVWLPSEEQDEPKKQPVEVGEEHKGRVEILSGLDEGDVILLKKPEGE
jgi:multidrug efflux pump subunit AcrA (membrane-fusion protein)